MAICVKCGAQAADDAAFCPACGAPMAIAEAAQTPPPAAEQPQYQQPQYGQQQYQQAPPPGYVPPPNPVNYNDPVQDWQANKVYGILAYIGFLVLVTIFAAPKESRYSRFHANQGLVLFIVEVVIGIILAIISAIVIAASVASGFYFSGAFAGLIILNIIRVILFVGCAILAILGIVNAAKGEQKPLPIIGKFKILK